MTKTDRIIAYTAAFLGLTGTAMGFTDLARTGDVSWQAFALQFSWLAVLVGYSLIRPRRA
ncbi:hypothetical protein KIKIMORA_00100 [Brevundimonas phage vB_BpoS-Kikimora]|uniref:Uncharacterized protein n=1 Tax=Brevundimonas phage vB_BpoS-Kikimora TaxID=2948601 RepID=A0A9E7MSU0_9CAUD|nr:hypothetical protein KIKIMORA_00100 [Brevundimonas phage vB_BpoS-Kikimora]